MKVCAEVLRGLYTKRLGVEGRAKETKEIKSAEAAAAEAAAAVEALTDGNREAKSATIMDTLIGLLRVRVLRGVNLAVRDVRTSDPYVVLKLGTQKLKTRVISGNVNPEWNEDLTLSISDPDVPIKLTVYDYDTFSKDDKMGNAEFSIKLYVEAVKKKLSGIPSGTVITKIQPSRQNCLAHESTITLIQGKVVQDLCLRLNNVECGEVELQLQWIDLPGSKGR